MGDDLADRLLCVLRAQTGVPTVDYAEPPVRLTGGFWAELLAFELRNAPTRWEGPLVARVMPEPTVARKETVIQTAAADAGVPTPRVRGAGAPDEGLGWAYMVMDRADGVPLLSEIDDVAGLMRAPRRLWRMPDLLGRAMATLHAVDPRAARDQLAGIDGVARTVPEMLEHLKSWTTETGRDDLVDASRWLIEHPVDAGNEVICHGDLHPFNVLIDGQGQVTVLDWSTSVLAPRALDVAFTSLLLSMSPIVVPRPLTPVVRAAGRGLARRFRNRYRHYSGHTIDRACLAWFQALVCLRALAEVASWEHDGVIDSRTAHPWLVGGPQFAAYLGEVTGLQVRPV